MKSPSLLWSHTVVPINEDTCPPRYRSVITDQDGSTVAIVFGSSKRECKARAQFIAAAPEAKAALEEAYSALTDPYMGEDEGQREAPVAVQIERAIIHMGQGGQRARGSDPRDSNDALVSALDRAEHHMCEELAAFLKPLGPLTVREAVEAAHAHLHTHLWADLKYIQTGYSDGLSDDCTAICELREWFKETRRRR